jgi:16S rRNA (cytosine1402-N4)-methyltransferase
MTTDGTAPPHTPVLLGGILRTAGPISGVWLDGTFGAGGYARGLLDAGADVVIGVDRDPLAFELAAPWAATMGDRLILVPGTFSDLDAHAATAGHPALDGVTLDLGVSSMQLDRAERGFSFLRDGPLDMRMGQDGPSAADLVNDAPEALLADIIHYYGEERAARRIARKIVAERAKARIDTTLKLAAIVESCLPRKKPGQSHPATRTFQALRIAVNDELGQLVSALSAAERALKPGGKLAVVTFHSIEDRIVKRFLAERASSGGGGSRHAPAEAARETRLHAHAEKGHRTGRRRNRFEPPRAVGQVACRHPDGCARRHRRSRRLGLSADRGSDLMRSFPVIFAALAVIGLGYWAYSQTILTQTAIRDVERLQREIGAESERLSVLRAEWAYLNRPDRLRELVDFNFERLQLLPMVPEQFGAVAELPSPRPAPDPMDQVQDLLFENASTGTGNATP